MNATELLFFLIINFIFCLNGVDNNLMSSNKRKADEIVSSQRRGKISVARKDNKPYMYKCSSCDIAPRRAEKIQMHMHNACYPQEITCLDCDSSRTIFAGFNELVDHYLQHHENMVRWRCYACGANVNFDKYFHHFKTLTSKSRAEKYLDGYTEEMYAEKLAHYTSNQKAKEPVNRGLNWYSYTPTLNEQGVIILNKK